MGIVAALSTSLYAVDGVVLINQSQALAGNITPGDAPGFPVTISQSGSYRLTGNLIIPDANTTAIQITAENVTLDLNGLASSDQSSVHSVRRRAPRQARASVCSPAPIKHLAREMCEFKTVRCVVWVFKEF
jgi:hypothetical protein